MSTVTLSKPHCAITSAEKPDGIASQAFTTALPEAHTFLTLFATLVPSLLSRCYVIAGNASLRSQGRCELCRCPLNADFADADFACGIHYRRPGVVRQGYPVF